MFVCALVLYEWGVLSGDIVGKMAAIAEALIVWRVAVLGWRIMMVCMGAHSRCLATAHDRTLANEEAVLYL